LKTSNLPWKTKNEKTERGGWGGRKRVHLRTSKALVRWAGPEAGSGENIEKNTREIDIFGSYHTWHELLGGICLKSL